MSLDEEVRHWKDRANDLEDALREAESSLQDFMESSKALEAEMEKEIAASNQAQLELQTRNERLKSEIETWKVGRQAKHDPSRQPKPLMAALAEQIPKCHY